MDLKIKKGSENYVGTIVSIDTLLPIEGKDRIQNCIVFANNVIVSKNVKVGDKLIYFPSGTKLDYNFCAYNDLFTDKELNRNKVAGYISPKKCLVKALKLGGIISDGMLVPMDSLRCYFTEAEINTLQLNDEFTNINGIDICEKYVVTVKENEHKPNSTKSKKPRFNRMVDNQFILHNDTSNLRKNIHLIDPDDTIGIHYKKHGTSAVFANILVKRQLSFLENILKFFGFLIQETYYDIVYSSRKVIKNQYLNPTSGGGFYGEDIWGTVAKEIGHLIPKNWTLYGEIVGYTPQNRAIQAKYDYGCKNGEHKFYVYKISVTNPDGKVIYLTDAQIAEWCKTVGLLYEDTMLFYGKAKELYPIRKNGNVYKWQQSFLEFLQNTYNEKDCYMCANKVPEEGVVLRIESLFSYDAYKLKSKRFILNENSELDNGVSNLEDE